MLASEELVRQVLGEPRPSRRARRRIPITPPPAPGHPSALLLHRTVAGGGLVPLPPP